MEKLLENDDATPESPPISVESDDRKDFDIFSYEWTRKNCCHQSEKNQKALQPAAGIANFFHQLRKEKICSQPSNIDIDKTNESDMPTRMSWTDWKLKTAEGSLET